MSGSTTPWAGLKGLLLLWLGFHLGKRESQLIVRGGCGHLKEKARERLSCVLISMLSQRKVKCHYLFWDKKLMGRWINDYVTFSLLALISCPGMEADQLSCSTDTTTFISVGMRCLCKGRKCAVYLTQTQPCDLQMAISWSVLTQEQKWSDRCRKSRKDVVMGISPSVEVYSLSTVCSCKTVQFQNVSDSCRWDDSQPISD